MLKRILCAAVAAGALFLAGSAAAQEYKIALIADKTGFLEAYAKETETGFMMGLEYLTGGKMEVKGRALQTAIGPGEMLAAGFGDTRFFTAEGNHFPKGSPFYSAAGTDRYNQRDARGAKEAAEKAGYKGEPIRVLTSRQYDFHYNMAQIMAEQLKRAGFKAELNVVEWATLLQRRADPKLWDIYFTHSGLFPEPMLSPPQLGDGAPGWWSSPAKTQALAALNQEPNPPSAARCGARCSRWCMTRCPTSTWASLRACRRARRRCLTAETTTVGATSAATLYAYDANGNTVTKTTPSGPIEYVYNDANRLVEMRQSGERTTYAYDADGLRIAQTRHPASGHPVTTPYLQDPSYAYSQVIEQWRREGAGATQLEATYAFADELIAQTRYAGAAATTAFVQADGFGSVRWLTDAAGVVTDGVEYDAFGNEVYRSGSTPTEHLYRGVQFDPILGFYYLRARYMDPSAGRFTQQDAFNGLNTDPRSLHKYLYAHADPINNSDPSGNFIVPWTMAPSLLLSSVGRTVLWSAARPALVQAARRATLYTLGAAALIAATTVQDDRDSPPIFLVGSDHPEVRDTSWRPKSRRGLGQ